MIGRMRSLEPFVAGKSIVVGDMALIEIIFTSGRTVVLTEELKKLKIRQGLFSIEVSGRFNYIRINRFSVSLIRFYLGVANEERSAKDASVGDGEEGIGVQRYKMDKLKRDKNREGNAYNV